MPSCRTTPSPQPPCPLPRLTQLSHLSLLPCLPFVYPCCGADAQRGRPRGCGTVVHCGTCDTQCTTSITMTCDTCDTCDTQCITSITMTCDTCNTTYALRLSWGYPSTQVPRVRKRIKKKKCDTSCITCIFWSFLSSTYVSQCITCTPTYSRRIPPVGAHTPI